MVSAISAQPNDKRLNECFSVLSEKTAARIAAGDQHVGWKVGLNSSGIQQQFDLKGPILGPLTSSTYFADGLFPGVEDGIFLIEAELAVRVGIDEADPKEPQKLVVDAMAPAFELICINGPIDDLSQLLISNSYHSGFSTGDWISADQIVETGVESLELKLNREQVASLDPKLIVATPEGIVEFARAFLAARGEQLASGDIILCGALHGPVLMELGAEAEANVRPFGQISCRLTGS